MMVRIRVAAAKDAPGIAGVQIDTWRDTYAGIFPIHVFRRMGHHRLSAQWSKALRNSTRNNTVIVAEVPYAGIIGFGSCCMTNGVDLRYQGEVDTLYVHPNFQGQAVGRSLLARLFRVLATKGLDSALIWVLAENPARFFYEAMGGTLIAKREERLWGVPLREMAYGWSDLNTAIPRIECGTIAKPHSN